MMLADMGADVLLVDRPSGSDLGLGHERRHDVMLRGRRSVTLDLKSRQRRRRGAAPGGARRRDRRGLSPRRDGAPRPRPGGAAGAQPEAGLRPHDRLGPGRAARRPRRPRHQLHRPVGRAARDRPGRRAAGAAAQPGRRLRRRRHAARVRHRLRRDRGAQQRPRPGRRRGDGRRRLAAGDDVLRHARRRQLARGTRAATSSTPARPGTTATGPATASSSRSARSSRSSTPSCWRASASIRRQPAEAARSHRLAAVARALRGGLRRSQPRRMVHRVRRLRRLLRARCSASPSRAAIRMSRPAPGRSSSPASPSRRRRRASTAPRARRRRPPPERGEGGAEALADWGFDAAAIEDLGRLGVGFAR